MKFVQAKHHYVGGNEPALIVIHDMEYGEKAGSAEWCADFFASGEVQASAHYAVDADSVVQCVKDTDGAWHCPGSLPAKGGREINRTSIGIEHAGFAKQTLAEWTDEYSRAMLELSAELTATLCLRYDIPPIKLSPEDLKTPNVRGICGHVDCTTATGVGSHWDPGPNFPWDWYLARVAAHMAMVMKPPVTALSDEVPADWSLVSVGTSFWRVAPSYIWPIGIGQAEEFARSLSCELPTPELVDAIWRAADLKLEPIARSVDNGLLDGWGTSMSTLATFNDQAARIEAQIAGREYRLLAGMCKDVVVHDGKLGLYGWHKLDGRVVQPFFAGHVRGWIDYSQGLRLVRRV